MLRRLVHCAVLAAVSFPALAQSNRTNGIEQRFTAAEMHEAGLDTLSAAQLAALNRLLREKAAQPTTSSASAPPRTDDQEANRSYIGLHDKPIHSRAAGTVAGWEPGTVFVLKNGQQWKVLKGAMKLREPLQAPEIAVVPGIAGRWFLQVDEDMPKARVYRID
jgi:hypothetical protein